VRDTALLVDCQSAAIVEAGLFREMLGIGMCRRLAENGDILARRQRSGVIPDR